MSRSKRNAALQLPTSFRYQQSNEQDNRRGRGRTFRRDTSENDPSMAIQASLEASNLGGTFPDASSSNARSTSASGGIDDVDPLVSPFEALVTADSELSARYLEALSLNSRNAPLEEFSFPPLPVAQPKSQQDIFPLKNTMAAHLRRQKIKNSSSPNSSAAWPVASRSPVTLAITSQHAQPTSNSVSGLGSCPAQNKQAADNGHALSSSYNSPQARLALIHDSSSFTSYSLSHTQHVWPAISSSSGLASISGPSKPATENGPSLATCSSSLLARPAMANEPSSGLYSSSKNRGGSSKISHSSSAPNLVDSGSFDSSATDFPPVSATQIWKLPTASQVITNVEDNHTANKSLVEMIRIALDFDQDKFSAFKDMSAEYRHGSIDAETYLIYVEQFGLSHLVLELARLCPDAWKQKELIETYSGNMVVDVLKKEKNMVVDAPQENARIGASRLKDVNGSKKEKEKSVDTGNSSSKDVEVLSKDGYRAAKGKSRIALEESQAELFSPCESTNLKGQNELSAGGGSNQDVGDNDGRQKPRKKSSKFHRIRLGDDSLVAILDLKNPISDPDPDPDLNKAPSGGQNNSTEGLPVHGVWHSGGGQKLFAMTLRGPKK